MPTRTKPLHPRLNRRDPLAVGLVLGMPFAEGGGTVVRDVVGHNDGTLINAGVSWATGVYGPCLSFGGTDGYVDCGNSSNMRPTIGLSYAYWIKTTSVSALQQILRSDNGVGLPAFSAGIGNTSGKLFVFVQANGGSLLEYPVTTDWTHVCQTWDGSTQTLYVNGEPVASQSAPGNLTYNTDPLTVGARFVSGGVQIPYQGLFDSLIISGRALSQPEVSLVAADAFRPYRSPRRILKAKASAVLFRRNLYLRTGSRGVA